MAELKDSGERTEYTTGAVRDCKEGKGRCDLMPTFELADVLEDKVISYIGHFRKTGKNDALVLAIHEFCRIQQKSAYNMMLEVAIHFEDGARKYGENNWQKGIPVHSYIDSAIRHYCKFMADWTDEPHDRAFVWNLLCAMWTMNNHPELDDFTDNPNPNSSISPNGACAEAAMSYMRGTQS